MILESIYCIVYLGLYCNIFQNFNLLNIKLPKRSTIYHKGVSSLSITTEATIMPKASRIIEKNKKTGLLNSFIQYNDAKPIIAQAYG